MVLNMKDSGKTINLTERVEGFLLMETFMKDNGKMELKRVMGFIAGLTMIFTKGSFWIIKEMDKESFNGKTDNNMKVNGKMIR